MCREIGPDYVEQSMAYLTKAAKAGASLAVELVYHPPENLKLRLFLRRIECVLTAMTKAASYPEKELGAVTWVSYVEDQPCRRICSRCNGNGYI